jgi:hypothetical protein
MAMAATEANRIVPIAILVVFMNPSRAPWNVAECLLRRAQHSHPARTRTPRRGCGRPSQGRVLVAAMIVTNLAQTMAIFGEAL